MKPEEPSQEARHSGLKRGIRGISILFLILRIVAIFGTLGGALAMGTANQTLPFSTRAVLFQAQYNDIPTFRFFVITNGVACGYLTISLLLAIYHVISTRAAKSRVLLILLDVVMLAVLTAGASAAAAIVYLAHNGNSSANWFSICKQYQSFCERITGSLIGSFAASFILILLIPMSGLVLYRQRC